MKIDPSRIASEVVGGIGFHGAGMTFIKKTNGVLRGIGDKISDL